MDGSGQAEEGGDSRREAFLERIDRIASSRPAAILLREKDLSEEEYEALARQVMAICAAYGVPCILHTYVDAAARLGAHAVHLPQAGLARPDVDGLVFGVSCHSLEEALEAERLGCAYLTAGHIFNTDCKGDLPGRGLSFLQEVCAQVNVPVLAIGGIGPDNIGEVRRAGAAGACIMSSCMQCEDPNVLLDSMR